MKVIRKTYNMVNTGIQNHTVIDLPEAARWIAQKERICQDVVNLEKINHRSLDAVKINDQWVIVETDIQD